jgi:autotransporter-associated beta strand protein
MSRRIHSCIWASILRRTIVAGAALTVLILGLAANAAVVTWTGGGVDDSWGTAANWADGPVVNGSDLVFGPGASKTWSSHYVADGISTIKSVTFSSTGYAIWGDPLSISEKIVNQSGSSSWGLATTFTGPSGGLVENTSTVAGDLLTLNSSLDNNGNLLTLSAAATTGITVYGNINGGGGLLVNGGGTVTLNSFNGYSGATTIADGGILSIAMSENLGGSAIILAGGALQTTGGFTNSRNVTLNPGVNAFDVTTDTLTLTGAIDGTAGFTKQGAGTLLLNAANSFTGDVTVSQGTLSVAADDRLGNSANQLILSGGTLNATTGFTTARNISLVGSGSVIGVATANTTLVVDGVISGEGVTKSGPGLLRLAGSTANTMSGPLVVNRGILLLAKPAGVDAMAGDLAITPIAAGSNHPLIRFEASQQIPDTANIVLNGIGGAGGGHVDLNGFDETINNLTINNNQGTGSSTIQTGAGTLTILGSVTMTGASQANAQAPDIFGAGKLRLTGNHIAGNLSLGSGVREFNVTAPNSLSNNVVSALVSDGGILKTGGQRLVLNNAGNTFAGGLTIAAGEVAVPNDGALGDAANVITLQGGGLAAMATFATSRQIVLGAGVNSIGVDTGFTFTMNGSFVGSTGFQKTGGGALALRGDGLATFSGTLTLNDGVLDFAEEAHLGGPGVSLVFNGGGVQYSGATPFTLSRELTGGNSIFGVVEPTGPLNVTGLTSTGVLTKIGAGALELSGDTDVQGLTVTRGLVLLNKATGNVVAGGNVAINSSTNSPATLRLAVSDQIHDGAIVSLSANGSQSALFDVNNFSETIGGLTMSTTTNLLARVSLGDSGTLTVNGDITLNNNRDSTGNTNREVLITGSGVLATPGLGGTLDLGGATRTITVSASHAQANSGATIETVIRNGGITKAGAQRLVLSNPGNTFAGGLTITGGSVAVPNDGALGDAANVITLQGGGLAATASFSTMRNIALAAGAQSNYFDIDAGQTLDLGGVVSGNDGMIKTGAGTLRLSGSDANTYLGTTVVNRGVLELGKAGVVAVPGHLDTLVSAPVVGGNNPIIRLLAPEQIANTSNVTLRGVAGIGGGQFDLGGFDETINDLSIVNEQGTGSIVVLAEGATLSVLGNISVSGVSAGTSVGGLTTLTGNHIHGGTLNVGSVQKQVYVSSTAPLTISSTLQGTATLVKQGNTELILRGGTSSFSGAWRIEGGTVTSSPASGTGQALGTGNIVLVGGSLALRDNGAGSRGVLPYGNNVQLDYSSTIDINRASGGNVANAFEMGTLNLPNNSSLTLTGGNAYELRFTGQTTFSGAWQTTIDTPSTVLELGGGLNAGNNHLVKYGNGTLRIIGPVTNLAGVSHYGGTLQLPTQPAGSARDVSLPWGMGLGAGWVATQANLIDRITFDSAGVAAIGVDSTFNPNFTGFTNGLRFGASDAATLNGVITPAADGIVRLGGGGGALTLATTNAVTGAVNLNIGANGTLPGAVVLAADNDFTGTVTIHEGGTLGIANLSSIGNSTGPINVDNGTLRLANGGAFATLPSRTISIGSGGATLDTDGNDVAQPIIVGSGKFTKAGNGVLTLDQVNSSFSGPVAIDGGTLQVNVAGALGSGTAQIQIADGGTLALNVGGLTIANTFSINGAGVGGTGAIRNVSGDNTITGSVTFASAASIISEAGTLTLNPSTGNALVGPGAVTIGGAGNVTISKSTQNNIISMTKIGAGTLTFSADPNQTGSFFVNEGVAVFDHASGSTDMNIFVNSGGTVRVVRDNLLGDGYDVTLNGTGTLDMRGGDTIRSLQGDGVATVGVNTGNRTLAVGSGNSTFTFAGTTVDTAGMSKLNLTKTGSGTMTLTGTNAGTGNVQINTGTIVVSGPNGRLSNGGVAVVGDNSGNDESMVLGSTADTIVGVLDRVGDTGTLRFNGSVPITYYGAAAGGATVETAATLQFNAGTGVFNLVPDVGGEVEVVFTNLLQSNNATGVIRGTGLGLAAGTPNSSRMKFVNDPTVGGVIPFLLTNSANSPTAAPDTFLGYDAANGATAIAAFAPTLAGGAGQVVSVAGGETLGASVSINALRITGGTTTVGAGNTLDIASSSILFTGEGVLAGPGEVAFGARPAVIRASADGTPIVATVSAKLNGHGGLAIGSTGNANHTVALSGDLSALYGNVHVSSGSLRLVSPLNDSPRTITGGYGASIELHGNDLLIPELTQLSVRNTHDTANATVRAHLTAGRTYLGALADGGSAKLNFVLTGGQTMTTEQNHTLSGSVALTGVNNVVTALQIQGGNGRMDAASSYDVYGGTLRIHNTGNNRSDRIANAAPITLYSGTFDFSNEAGDRNYSETIGPVHVHSGSNFIWVDRAQSTTNRTSVLTAQSLTRDVGGLVVFRSQNNGAEVFDLGVADQSRLVLTTAPTLDDGIIGPWAVVQTAAHARQFAKYVTTGVISVRALESADYATSLGAGAAANVRLTASTTMAANSVINSLTINQTADTAINLGAGNTLRVESGGVIFNNSDVYAGSLTGGSITAGTGENAAGELVVHVVNSATKPALMRSVIADNGTGAVTLTKASGGVLDLQTMTNTYSGPTYVSGGTLRINADANLGNGGDVILSGNGILDVTSSTAINGRTLRMSGHGTVIAAVGTNLTFNGNFEGTEWSSLALRGDIDLTATSGVTLGALNIRTANNTGSSDVVLGGLSNTIAGSLLLSADGGLAAGDTIGAATLSYHVADGSFSVGTLNAGTNLDIGVRTVSTVQQQAIGAMDLAGSANFVARLDQLRLGVTTVGAGTSVLRGTLTLSTNSDIIANRVTIGDSSNQGIDGTNFASRLSFGGGVNLLTASEVLVAGRKGRGTMDMAAGGTLTLGGFGPATANLFVARNNQDNTGNTAQGVFDMSLGTFIADLNQIVVGYKDGANGGAGGANGVLSLGASANQVTANTLVLGQSNTGSSGVSLATLNMAGGTFSVAGNVSMGLRTGTNGAGKGLLNLTGGTFTIGGDIVKSANNRSSALVTVDGGTLDLTGGSIAASQLAYRSGSVQNVAATSLDGYDLTASTALSNLANALVLRDVALPGSVALTNPTANAGGVLYEAAGGGSGGAIQGAVDMGSVSRTFTVEDSPVAARDLTVYGVVSGTGNLTKAGAGTLGLAVASAYAGDTNVLAGVLQTRTVTSGGTGAGNTTVSDGATLIADVIIQNSLVIGAGATVELTPSALHSVVWPTAETSVAAALNPTAYAGGGGGGGSAPVALVGASAVPEPATWVMLLMAAAAGLFVLRKRK